MCGRYIDMAWMGWVYGVSAWLLWEYRSGGLNDGLSNLLCRGHIQHGLVVEDLTRLHWEDWFYDQGENHRALLWVWATFHVECGDIELGDHI